MKRVRGYFSCRPLGTTQYEFYVNDDVSSEQIEEIINDRLEISENHEIEEGYEEVFETTYRKRRDNDWAW